MSWALRSLLSRPHPLLLFRLRPVSRRASHQTAVLGSSNLIGSRGHASDSSVDLHAEAKRHLYVVLDDHEAGYGIHKLDLSGDEQDDVDLDGAHRRLPQPPVHRVALATVGERAQFAGVGRSIVAVGASRNVGCWGDHCDFRMLLIYHTETATMEVTHHFPKGLMEEGYKAAVAVGGRLYMLESATAPEWRSYSWNSGGSVHCLRPQSVVDGGGWSTWMPLSYYSRWSWSQRWKKPLTPPFWANYITACAGHAPAQDDHEIVVSVGATHDRDGNPMEAGTFSFSTASLEWTRRGEWLMPVDGHAHYDAGLDAFVGLHAVVDKDGRMDRVTDGRLCVGQVTSVPTEWKVGREKLFRLDEDIVDGWRHLDAKLVPMAPREGGGEYCLVERLLPPEVDKEEEKRLREKYEESLVDIDEIGEYLRYRYQWLAEEKECLLRLSAFRVELGHDGEPVATARRPARLYSVSRYNSYFDAHAFWM